MKEVKHTPEVERWTKLGTKHKYEIVSSFGHIVCQFYDKAGAFILPEEHIDLIANALVTAAERDGLKEQYSKQAEMLINAVSSIQVQISRLNSANDPRLKPVIDDLTLILTGPIDTTPMDKLKEENERLKKDLSDCQDYTPSFLSSFNEKMSKLQSINRELVEALQFHIESWGNGLKLTAIVREHIETVIQKALKNSTL